MISSEYNFNILHIAVATPSVETSITMDRANFSYAMTYLTSKLDLVEVKTYVCKISLLYDQYFVSYLKKSDVILIAHLPNRP